MVMVLIARQIDVETSHWNTLKPYVALLPRQRKTKNFLNIFYARFEWTICFFKVVVRIMSGVRVIVFDFWLGLEAENAR